MNSVDTSLISVPESVFDAAVKSVGLFFSRLNGSDPKVAIADFLNPQKSIRAAGLLEKYVPLREKKLLEIGSGYGTNIAVWINHFNVDAYGVEPEGEGFDQSFKASRELLIANGLDPERIVNAVGESLPFDDASFDIVYSANVLEHTQDPIRVLREAVRVLRPGGILHFEIPNYLSYFEGHYLVMQPPVIWRWVLPVWLKWIFRRDPAFARTLQTQINPVWCRKAVKQVGKKYPLTLISLGEDLFLKRLAQPFDFEMKQVAGRLRLLISIMQRVNVANWIGRLIVMAQGFYPIYLTLRREEGKRK